ncbi:4Fe-4S dicluster domain-containing protein [Nakamurella sp. PAMC28650]|uniref:4Fe-4S dicluster domain-containing protein n=1 Tax=Nakamurella sp. PAMC28650 TaxID=2762325 RepID=UPI00164D7EA3|nr:4Fe-4S dicluster domain-containing protein [Nakamurella sp. PAMC28650]QNK80265.1 4Fe-4S dicluster domain-containing protein [Nakamurella sp. PAMC28650]
MEKAGIENAGNENAAIESDAPVILTRAGLDELVEVLISSGYRVIGPTVRDNAIVLEELLSGDQLPSGWGVDSGPGSYRLRRRSDAAVFGHSAGSQSWKEFLHPPRQPLWSMDGDQFVASAPVPVRYAFLGVRACDLAAISKLGVVLGGGARPDGAFARRRAGLLVIAAGCTEPGGVCFCASMGTGPAPGPGYDLSLTERIDASGHRFLVDVGTEAGARIIGLLAHRVATESEVTDAREAVGAAAQRMGRQMPITDIRALLQQSRESPLWEDVAQRCLTCGNCTMVCPTCFCTTTEDLTDLTGEQVERSERWASCFETDFSYLHGGSVRTSGASRYRQWITHKLGTWHDQFGSSGCVGCGRCIAWCPVGIDITAEITTLADQRDDLEAGVDVLGSLGAPTEDPR